MAPSTGPADARFGGARVLIVEDQPLIALDLESAIIDAGGTVSGPATSVAEAKGLCDQSDISAAILDVNLRDGLITPVAAALCARNIPVVFHTGHAGEMDAVLEDACCHQYAVVDKPALTETVVAALLALLQRQTLSKKSHDGTGGSD
jgi:DNA-binding response OmpR family regulator